MKTILRTRCYSTIAIILFGTTQAMAQLPNFHRIIIDAGGGVTPTLGDTSNHLSTGWNIVGGAGLNFSRHIGSEIQVMYDGLGVNNSVLREFAVPGANSHLWGFTLNGIARVNPLGGLGFYMIGGGGYYRRVLNFTQPTTEYVTVFDPFFGFETIPIVANETIGTMERVGWGGNFGLGITHSLGITGVKLFGEIRYHRVSTAGRPTEVLPITVGFRW